MKNFIKSIAIILVLITGFALYGLSHQLGGFRAFIVSSGSMEPTISTGSLILSKYTHPSLLKKGDIITFIAPTKEREFVTHRVENISQKTNLSVIKTKGDHNKNIDNWTVAGGGVVGKVIYSIPRLGYFFSFSQTKIGIALLVLLPSIYILYIELGNIYNLVNKKNSKEKIIPTTTAASFLIILCLVSINSSSALLSDSVTLATNTFSVELVPTPTPTFTPTPTPTIHPTPTITITPTPPNTCNAEISGNGAGSTNTVECNSSKSTTITQSNTTSSTTIINAKSNTGGNTASSNTVNNSVTQTGSNTLNITSTTTTSNNSISQ